MSNRLVRNALIFALALSLVGAERVKSQTASTWEKLAPATSPAARNYFAMAYDPVSKKVVLFGGYGGNGYLNDTWTFDGSTWIQVATTSSPSARSSVSMAFDWTTKKLVLFGGFGGGANFLNDTWLWDGATSTWSQAQMETPPPGASGAMMFTDPKSGQAMMFGGGNRLMVAKYYATTWRWTGTSWEQLAPSTNPYARANGVATWDPIHHNIVLTGGESELVRTDNTWIWDGTDWTLESPAMQMPPMIGPGAIFDPAVQAVVVFAGFFEVATNGTWTWNGTDWVELGTTHAPPARQGVGMAFDPTSKQIIIFGGEDANGESLNDTWRLLVPE